MNYHLIEQEADTTFVDLSRGQIKRLHDEVFGETVVNRVSMDAIVKLELTYIPFLLFIILMVTTINLRWNKAYRRLAAVVKKTKQSEEMKLKMSELRMQKVNILDRTFVYLTVLLSSFIVDAYLLFTGITPFPYVAIPVIVIVISKKLKLLSQTSSLLGHDDTDIANNFDKIVSDMVVKPLIQGVIDRIKQFINTEEV